MSDLVQIGTFSNRLQADLAQSLLKQQEIESLIIADDAGGMLPSLDFVNGVRLYVKPEEAKKAESIISKISTE